jgi:hypothetical protein
MDPAADAGVWECAEVNLTRINPNWLEGDCPKSPWSMQKSRIDQILVTRLRSEATARQASSATIELNDADGDSMEPTHVGCYRGRNGALGQRRPTLGGGGVVCRSLSHPVAVRRICLRSRLRPTSARQASSPTYRFNGALVGDCGFQGRGGHERRNLLRLIPPFAPFSAFFRL